MEREIREKLWNAGYVKAWTANFLLYFSFMLLSPLLPLYLSETFGADKEAIGIVLSGYTLTALAMRMLSGYVVDTFPRKTVLLIGYFFFALFFAGYLAAGSLLLFAIVRTLHGAPFGLATIVKSTVAIDVLPSSRRTEGIGYYGLSNNVATAIGPTIALAIYGAVHSYDWLFALSLLLAGIGWVVDSTLRLPARPTVKNRPPLSLDRFFLLKGWSQGLAMICYGLSYGVVSTYIAIYGKEELGITGGTGLFFLLLAVGLILSRLTGSRTLRQGKIVQNAALGMSVSVCGYLLFAGMHNLWGYYGAALIIGLGNGHLFPAFQTMFINLTPNDRRGTANSTLYVSWDVGIGVGTFVGGSVAEYFGFHAAFWMAWAINALGVAIFFLYARRSFLKNRLR